MCSRRCLTEILSAMENSAAFFGLKLHLLECFLHLIEQTEVATLVSCFEVKLADYNPGSEHQAVFLQNVNPLLVGL